MGVCVRIIHRENTKRKKQYARASLFRHDSHSDIHSRAAICVLPQLQKKRTGPQMLRPSDTQGERERDQQKKK